jgi:hypothetical protein
MKYLHVHPEQSSPAEAIPFAVEVPAAGRYHLYLDFKVDGRVRTAHFVLDLGGMDGMDGMDHGDH